MNRDNVSGSPRRRQRTRTLRFFLVSQYSALLVARYHCKVETGSTFVDGSDVVISLEAGTLEYTSKLNHEGIRSGAVRTRETTPSLAIASPCSFVKFAFRDVAGV